MRREYVTKTVLDELEAKLSTSDLTLLRSVSSLRFMSGHQLQRMHFGLDEASARAARRALLRLTRLGLLGRLPRRVGGVRAGSKGFIYVLGVAGQRLAIRRGWQPKRRGRRSRSPGTFFLAHCLDVAELHVSLVLADRSRRLELMELSAEPVCHRPYAELGRQRVLKPDSFVRFGLGQFEWSWFIEVDRGTESSQVIQTKLRQYLRYQASGLEQARLGVFPKVLWSAPDEARAEVIWEEVEQLMPPSRELFDVALVQDVVEVLAGRPRAS